jgi:hypothetical protein
MDEMAPSMPDMENTNNGNGGSLTPARKRKRGRTRWGPDDGEEEGGSQPVEQTAWVSPTSLPPLEVELEGIRPQAAVAVQGTPKRRPKRRRWGPDEEDQGEGESPAVQPLQPENNVNGALRGPPHPSAETRGRSGEGGMVSPGLVKYRTQV